MIISNLSHLEVVFETSTSVSGAGTTIYTTADKVLSESIRKRLSPEMRALLKKSRGKVLSVSSKNRGASASAKVGSFSTQASNVKVSSSYSFASDS